MRKIFYLILFLILAILSLNFLYRFLPRGITGFVAANTSVNVSEVLKGGITALIFQEKVEWGEFQNISVEFTNLGSIPLTEKIELRIYFNYYGKLQSIAYYYDSQETLKPNERRVFKVSFLPPYLGLYYIKARVPYDGKVVERWEAFMVVYTPPPPQIIYPPTPAPPAAPPIIEVGVPGMGLEYPETVKIPQGETKLFSILVKNTGTISLNNIRLSVSTTSLVEIEVNPKQVFKLYPNESAIFLVSVSVPNATPAGSYPFDFEVISDKIKEGRSIVLEILSIAPPIREEVYETILNYEYLISEIQREVDVAALKGIDVSQVIHSLEAAKIGLEIAKRYYQQEKYEEAKRKLAEVRKNLEEAVFQLAVASIVIYFPVFPPVFMILIAAVLIPILVLLIVWRRRKKKEEKRPKLLREIKAEIES